MNKKLADTAFFVIERLCKSHADRSKSGNSLGIRLYLHRLESDFLLSTLRQQNWTQ